jgi:hypothetical protein
VCDFSLRADQGRGYSAVRGWHYAKWGKDALLRVAVVSIEPSVDHVKSDFTSKGNTLPSIGIEVSIESDPLGCKDTLNSIVKIFLSATNLIELRCRQACEVLGGRYTVR